MVSLGVLRAKLKRNGFIESAGKCYVDETSEIVKRLKSQGEEALVGIQNSKGTYTIIGEEFIHYRTASGNASKVPLSGFIKELENHVECVGYGYL